MKEVRKIMNKHLLKAVQKKQLSLPNTADDVMALGLVWKPGCNVDVYQNTSKRGFVALNFGVRIDREKQMVAEAQLCFYRRNRRDSSGCSSLAYAFDEKGLEEVVLLPEFSHFKNAQALALLDIVRSFNNKAYAVHKNDSGFTLQI